MQAQGATNSAVDSTVHSSLRKIFSIHLFYQSQSKFSHIIILENSILIWFKLYSLGDTFLRYAIELLLCFISVKIVLLRFNCASCISGYLSKIFWWISSLASSSCYNCEVPTSAITILSTHSFLWCQRVVSKIE